ncbi:hypothetical protein H310_09606 [Aphanomyces invadans]|uniref:Uncharacterized protein n=1 Tax=Aphanomyces invadans TaxID=157072 RepID=A0A024TSU6_9STRA|nr:hypothetical protein H310_09606 [Aphanomyces invadans]ETV97225.1 hypothetical protein H310_09606 [Aphanomyces invadans]RHY27899.1 hypothetical protein DYB32_006447 [Aphanomyces invadans]|eukprot:XP_008873933.1 hypothetical protein H310_09606 [Aphanomyces invadans]
MSTCLATLQREVLTCRDLLATIALFQHGYIEAFVPLAQYGTAPHPITLDAIASIQSLLTPWLALHGHDLLPRLYKVLPAIRRVAVIFAIATPHWFHLVDALGDDAKVLHDSDDLIVIAAMSGQVASICKLQARQLGTIQESAMVAAATHGHLNVVIFLHATLARSLGPQAMVGAAAGGHLDILKFFHTHQCDDVWSTDVMDAAAAHGHLETVQFLHLHRSEGCTTTGLLMAARHGHVHVVQWFHAHRKHLWRDSHVMTQAARGGHVSILRYILDKSPRAGCTIDAMDTAATFGHLDVVQFLHSRRTDGCTDVALRGAIANGHDHLVDYLKVHGPSLIHSLCCVCGCYKPRNHDCAVYNHVKGRQRMAAGLSR